jgi:hypothetical protein
MKVLWSVLLLLAVGIGLAARPAQAATRERTGPDSFLKWRAMSVDEFMAEYDQDPVLRVRLAKHFHVPEAYLTSYLRTNLRVVPIRESGWVTVYGVNSIGRIYKSRDYLRRGAKALGLPDGTPLLKLPCGNPFITELPPVKVVLPEPLPVVSEVVEQPLVVAAPEILPPVQQPEEFVLLTETPRAPLLAPVLAQPVTPVHMQPWWLPVAVVPFLHGDHGYPPTPEPSSLLCLVAGTALLGVWARRRRPLHG